MEAAFSSASNAAGNSFAASADFEAGRLLTWGNTYRHTATPARVGTGTDWTSTAGSASNDCGVRSPGTLWCWGANGTGQLGLGDTVPHAAPTQVGTATNWTSVTMGVFHTCGLRSDGTLWCWGSNYLGQVGNGTTTEQLSPVQVTSPSTTGWSQLTSGYSSNCAVRSDATLWCWGSNASGNLGDGTTTQQNSPVQVTSPASTGWTAAAAGDSHTCATRSSGQLWCWGAGGAGQLGQGSTTSSTTAVQVPGTTWGSASAGRFHTCALKTDGTLWCWGDNRAGGLGIGTTSNATSPRQVGTAATWNRVALGQYHGCATRTDSTLWCWGSDGFGQIGDGAIVLSRTVPVQVTAAGTVSWALSTLGVTADGTCAVQSDSTLWCWGFNHGGIDPPTAIDANTWRKPASGTDFSCALRTTGALYCWGTNSYGQLGDGTTVSRLPPVQVGTDSTWTAVSAGSLHACAIRADTTLWCWGSNYVGQLGTGSNGPGYEQQTAPTQVTSPAATGWTQVSAGYGSTCALRGDALWCWGYNASGELGIGSTTQQFSPAPAQVTSPASSGWSAVGVGKAFACGLRGTALYCWGSNASGQLGTGSTTSTASPALVSGSWSSVSTGANHACALATAATLWCWGANTSGQLGTGGTTSTTSPTQVGTDTWRTVSASTTSTCGTITGPSVWCWGDDQYGQLGFPDGVSRSTPTRLTIKGRPVDGGSSSWTATLIVPGP